MQREFAREIIESHHPVAMINTPQPDGWSMQAMFPNGYGVSVISHEYSYGGREGLAELAVLDENRQLAYDTTVTSDVLGYLDEDLLVEAVAKVAALKPETYRDVLQRKFDEASKAAATLYEDYQIAQRCVNDAMRDLLEYDNYKPYGSEG